MIYINIPEVAILIFNVESRATRIDTSLKSVPNAPSCSGLMVDEYIERIGQISALLDKYKLLVHKDMQEVKDAQQVFAKADIQAKINILARK